MKLEVVREMLLSQMLAALETLGSCIERCDESMWSEPHPDTPFGHVVHHTLYYADLYLCSDVSQMEGQPFHAEHGGVLLTEHDDDSPAYSRDLLLAYHAFCSQKSRATIMAETDDTLEGPSGFHWRKCTRAELHVYNTRHIQHHAAQLGLRFQLADLAPLAWIGEGGKG